MQTKMQDTSLMAFWGEIEPTLQPRQKEIVQIFRENYGMDFTNKELADELGLDTCSITGRVWSLRGRGTNNPFTAWPLLIKSRITSCRITGRTAIAWQLNNK